MNKINNVYILIVMIAVISIIITIGAFVIQHSPGQDILDRISDLENVDYDDPDWECKKTVGMWELAKKEFPHFVENTKWLADKKCGFDVSNIIP